ncbi:hypothetical protein [Curtobacterium sp. MCBA15_008]|uniref:hypothetical protein n=1 Tax=Curtobacterium sp. MCBA15_008 TaxID=1898736 RepID=UPI0008DE28DC|nr:hypothetical protein [Curtobacterium sp. MCBA15_008]OII05348.1 hypothetical protein BIU96_06780 [Curtobacterium sp. MCBA15_008]
MSSSDAQPPLSRREARERERAAAAGAQPVTPPPTVAAPADPAGARSRPGSHVAPAPGAPAQSAKPSSAAAPVSAQSAEPVSAPTAAAPAPVASSPSGVPSAPPASATEIVPGSGGLTRRQIRQMRAAEGQAIQPVPLQNPTPQSSDRTVQDVLGSVDALQVDPNADANAEPEGSAAQEPAAETVVLDQAAVAQATEADGSPDAIEPLEAAAAHAEEPRRHRSTWAPPDADATDTAVPDTAVPDTAAPDSAAPDGAAPGAGATDAPARETPADDAAAPPLPTSASSVASSTPAVFPLSLDEDDTNEVPVLAAPGTTPAAAPTSASRPVSAPTSAPRASGAPASEAPRVPASFQRPTEPKPVTTAFEPPVGHWSQQAHDSHDAEVHDTETGTRRVAVTNTNAIILPNSALADPTGALNATGEVILTGSIDLPASLSSTGSHRPIDGAEVDRLLEQHDEQPDTDASPVRASRAVSSHTSTRQVVLAAAKPKESRTPLILGVTVGAVGVAAAAVIIVALVTTHTFGG